MTDGEALTDDVQRSSAEGEDKALETAQGQLPDTEAKFMEWPGTDRSSPTGERPMTSPLDRPGTAMSLSSQCDAGSDGMMGLVRAHLTAILQPFAENVEELHKRVFDMTDSICDLSTQVDGLDGRTVGLEHPGLRTDLDQTTDKLNSMRTDFEKMMAERTEETAKLQATANKFEAISKQTLDKLDAVNALTQNAINQVNTGLEKNKDKLDKLEKAEEAMKHHIHMNQEHIKSHGVSIEGLEAEDIKLTDTITANKLMFDDHARKHEVLQQDLKDHCCRFDNFEVDSLKSVTLLREHLGKLENNILQTQTEMRQTREEASKTHEDAMHMLTARLDGHDESFDKVTERLQQLEERIGACAELVVQNGENTNKLIKLSDEMRASDVQNLRREVDSASADACKHSRILNEWQPILFGRPPLSDGKNRFEPLEDDMAFTSRRASRLEGILGLEPLSVEIDDSDAGLTLKNGVLLSTSQIEDFKKTFSQFDADGSSSISVLEVKEVLKSLGHDLEVEIVQFIINEIDQDHSGEIVFDEFCTMMSKILGPDGKADVDGYLKQVSEMAKREAKQNQMAELLPVLKKDVEQHAVVIQQEQSKLISATQRVRSLEGELPTMALEIEKLRKGLDANNEYWKGLSRGLKETKNNVRMEGEGCMLPSARNLRNLPPLPVPSHSSAR